MENITLKKFKDVANVWLNEKKVIIKETSVNRYQLILDRHLNPLFGEYSIKDISDELIKKYIDYLKQRYKPNTYIAILMVFKAILLRAYENRTSHLPQVLMHFNSKRPLTEHKVLSIDECRLLNRYLVSECGNSNKTLGSLIALNTGLRVGEIAALKWKNIDFEENSIYVEKTMQRVKNTENTYSKTILKLIDPKSLSSIRKVPIPTFLCQILQSYKESLNIQDKDKFVLSSRSKDYTEPRELERLFEKQCIEAIGRTIKFHDLRHTFASTAIANGIDYKTVSLILGHSDVAITLRIYTNVAFEGKLEASKKIESLIWH